MNEKLSYRQAVALADDSRARLLSSLNDAKARIAPSRLAADAKAKVVGSILDVPAYAVGKVRQRPFAIGAAMAAFLLYLFRRPVGALFNRSYVRWKNRKTENEDG